MFCWRRSAQAQDLAPVAVTPETPAAAEEPVNAAASALMNYRL